MLFNSPYFMNIEIFLFPFTFFFSFNFLKLCMRCNFLILTMLVILTFGMTNGKVTKGASGKYHQMVNKHCTMNSNNLEGHISIFSQMHWHLILPLLGYFQNTVKSLTFCLKFIFTYLSTFVCSLVIMANWTLTHKIQKWGCSDFILHLPSNIHLRCPQVWYGTPGPSSL